MCQMVMFLPNVVYQSGSFTACQQAVHTPKLPGRCKLVPLMIRYNKCQQLTSTLTKSQTSGSSITAGQPSMYRASQLNSYVGSRGS